MIHFLFIKYPYSSPVKSRRGYGQDCTPPSGPGIRPSPTNHAQASHLSDRSHRTQPATHFSPKLSGFSKPHDTARVTRLTFVSEFSPVRPYFRQGILSLWDPIRQRLTDKQRAAKRRRAKQNANILTTLKRSHPHTNFGRGTSVLFNRSLACTTLNS